MPGAKFAGPRDLWYLQRMIRIALVAGVGCLIGGSALADDALRLEVCVGDTIERDVGFAIGLRCDDASIARAELGPGTPESNRFTVTGVTEGITTCRVGTAPERPSYVFEIHVIAPRPRH